MSLWSYIWKERYKLAMDAMVTAIGFFIALVANSYVDDWKERGAFRTVLSAIKAEAESNEIVLHESFEPLYESGLVLREFSLTSVSQALNKASFVKHASHDELRVLGEYERTLTLANAYRAKAEAIRFNDSYSDPAKQTLKQWEANLVQAWGTTLSSCQKSITSVVKLE